MTTLGVLAETVLTLAGQEEQTPLEVGWSNLASVWNFISSNALVSAIVAGVALIFIDGWIKARRAGAKRPWLGLIRKLKSTAAAFIRWVGSIRVTTTTRQHAAQLRAEERGKAKGLEEGQAGSNERVGAVIKTGEEQLEQTRRSLSNEARGRNQKTDIAAARSKGREEGREEGYERGLKEGREASLPVDHGAEAAPVPSSLLPIARWKIGVEDGQGPEVLILGPVRFAIENLIQGSMATNVRVETEADFQFDEGGYWTVLNGRGSFSGTAHDASSVNGIEFVVHWTTIDGVEKAQKYKTKPWVRNPFRGIGTRPFG